MTAIKKVSLHFPLQVTDRKMKIGSVGKPLQILEKTTVLYSRILFQLSRAHKEDAHCLTQKLTQTKTTHVDLSLVRRLFTNLTSTICKTSDESVISSSVARKAATFEYNIFVYGQSNGQTGATDDKLILALLETEHQYNQQPAICVGN